MKQPYAILFCRVKVENVSDRLFSRGIQGISLHDRTITNLCAGAKVATLTQSKHIDRITRFLNRKRTIPRYVRCLKNDEKKQKCSLDIDKLQITRIAINLFLYFANPFF